MGVIKCAGCGSKVNSESPGCPECGADPRTGQSLHVSANPERAEFPRSCYLGGLPWAPTQQKGKLIFTRERVGFEDWLPDILLWTADIVSVDVADSETAKVGISTGAKVGLVAAGALTFGIAGVAGAAFMSGADKVNRVTLVVSIERDGSAAQAFFYLDDFYPNNVRDRLAPLLGAIGVPLNLSMGHAPSPEDSR